MGRPKRNADGGLVYHVLNRANARRTIFESDADYAAFQLHVVEHLLGEGGEGNPFSPSGVDEGRTGRLKLRARRVMDRYS